MVAKSAWKTKPLRIIATLQRGFDLPYRLRKPGPYPIVTSSGIEEFHSEMKVEGPGVVTGRYGTIGQVFFVPGPFWPLNTTLYVRDFHGNDPLFVAYLLRTVDFKEFSGKTGVPGINRNDVHQIDVLFPYDREEQERIAEALSDADALIDSLEQLLAKRRQIKQGAMQELLTGKKRLVPSCRKAPRFQDYPYGAFPIDWAPVRLDAVCDFITKGSTPTTYGFQWQNAGVLFLRSECVAEQGLDLKQSMFISVDAHRSLRRSEVRDGDILMTITGNVGRVVLLPGTFGEANINQHIARIRINSKSVYREFLFQFLSQSAVRQHYNLITTGQAYPQISLDQVRATQVPMPDIEEQLSIGSVLSDMDAQILETEQKLAKACQLKLGMMQELLTGRIRLVQPAAEVIPWPVADEQAAKPARGHNLQINEAVVIAVLTHRFGSDQYPLGRKRRTKLAYLLHRHSEGIAEGFQKKAAGPYNPEVRYGGAEKIALKNKYVQTRKTAKAEGFVAAENIAQAHQYFEKWYSQETLTWLDQFRFKKNDDLELLTTVDMAAEELRSGGRGVDVQTVKQIICENPEWVPKLSRALFSDENIARAIDECSRIFPQVG